MRVRWGTFGSVPTIFGILPNVVGRQGASSRMVGEHWQGASEAGKVPNFEKNFGRSIARQRDARRTSPCILHTFQSVNLPHGQWPAPMGSWRVLLFCRFPIGLLCSGIFGFVWIYVLEVPDPDDVPHYNLGVVTFAISTWIEMLAEPLWVVSQILLYVRIRVRVLGKL